VVRDVNPQEADEAIANTRLLFIDCWAPWCGPCKALAPVLEELEEKYKDEPDVKFIKLNTQNYGQFSARYSIVAIPCVLVFFEGKPAAFETSDPMSGKTKKMDRLIGFRPIEHYEKVIDDLL
jgi:thioredoxin 1